MLSLVAEAFPEEPAWATDGVLEGQLEACMALPCDQRIQELKIHPAPPKSARASGRRSKRGAAVLTSSIDFFQCSVALGVWSVGLSSTGHLVEGFSEYRPSQ